MRGENLMTDGSSTDGNRDIESILRSAARRHSGGTAENCPDMGILAACADGSAGFDVREGVQAHLETCDDCRRLVMECALSGLESSDSPVPLPLELRDEFLERLSGGGKESVPHLVFRAAKNLLELVNGQGTIRRVELSPARGDRAETIHRLVLGGYDVDAAVDCRRDGKYEVWLRLSGEESRTQSCDWQIWGNRRLLEQQPAEDGEVLFTNLEKGSYRCVLRLDGREVAAMRLTMEDARK
jgi:hypothetical protein